ncbi:acyl dehydratase [Streptomyces himalayensis]|uniref:Acyl dehydratase n=1 Tax=Streptomyces himalayensis subsp. himalayensis TaxID=2756131 RepID=A0A7W0DS24_9ACTN|nr:acyl dehydratase [Streptomyces himalayensis]MBA2950231.1 acyl dehydratase [Streptomyces himalayensis subsp. himalayensis]
MSTRNTAIPPDGPYGDDFVIGEPLPNAPAITIDEGTAALYQAISGDPARLSLSTPLSHAVTGADTRVVNSALALQVAIGQSTVATKIVIANLFYRDVTLHQQLPIGATVTSTVTPVARAFTRDNGKGRRAKVLLSIETRDEHGALVASLERLALLPLRDQGRLEEAGDIGSADSTRPLTDFLPAVPGHWDLTRLSRAALPEKGFQAADPLRDSISGALDLVRLTQNQAAAHRDPARGQRGRRLVYGGHTVALAQASLSRLVPGLAAVVGWRSCDHLAPCFEDDLLSFDLTCEDVVPVAGGALVGFRLRGRTVGPDAEPVDVLDFRPVALVAGNSGGNHV